jgi:hypothetical protein
MLHTDIHNVINAIFFFSRVAKKSQIKGVDLLLGVIYINQVKTRGSQFNPRRAIIGLPT